MQQSDTCTEIKSKTINLAILLVCLDEGEPVDKHPSH